MWSEFKSREITVIAIAQEDKDLESHGKIHKSFGDMGSPFEIVADLNREQTQAYDRTTTYLIDRDGVVLQIFPHLIHHRATWQAILHEIDRLNIN